MTYECFENKTFQAKTQEVIEKADDIIREYQGQGYTLSLRQLYYQFVARGLLENSDRSYKRLGSILTDARLAGLIPWDGIEDRNRSTQFWRIQEDYSEILSDLPYQFAADFWSDQDCYVEVWVEKDALSSVIERACRKWRVPYMACKGYLSASEAYSAAKRIEAIHCNGKDIHVFHLGDHDPSGIDMTRDNTDRLDLLSWGTPINFQRLALNRDQIDRYNPPPNPTKLTDSRADDYIAQHGYTSWELDALEPSVVTSLIEDAVYPLIDHGAWRVAAEREREGRDILKKLRDRWDDVRAMLTEEDLDDDI